MDQESISGAAKESPRTTSHSNFSPRAPYKNRALPPLPNSTAPSNQAKETEKSTIGISNAALGVLGGLSKAQEDMLQNTPPEMKPWAEMKIMREQRLEQLLTQMEREAVSSVPALPNSSTSSNKVKKTGSSLEDLEGILDSALDEIGSSGHLSKIQEHMVREAPLEMKPFMKAQIKLQREQEAEKLLTQMERQAAELRGTPMHGLEGKANSSDATPTVGTRSAKEDLITTKTSTISSLPLRPKSATKTFKDTLRELIFNSRSPRLD
ncbi:MAG: hypothetical protein Q9182_005757 [Xanthomendoza sp. 2 TL-2023]